MTDHEASELAAQAIDNMPALFKSMELERAGGPYKRFLLHPEARHYLIGQFESVVAQARREGREEVVQDAVRWTKEWDHREGDTMAFELVEHLENRFPLLNQPALSGAEE